MKQAFAPERQMDMGNRPATATPFASSFRGAGLGDRILRALRTRFGHVAARPARRLQVLETLSLGGQRQVTLIDCDGHWFLVGGGGGGQVSSIVPVRSATSQESACL